MYSSIGEVEAILDSGKRSCAMVAPSFPAEFPELEPYVLVGMLRDLGFDLVVEVAFGADLVARAYHQLLHDNPGRRYIATTCPAVVGYVEKYAPEIVSSLAPVVSPMTATAYGVHKIYGKDIDLVFIGPCLAKKREAAKEKKGGIRSVLTFTELRELFASRGVGAVQPSDFDPPPSGLGGLFPLSRGVLQAADIYEDLLTGEVVATSGKENLPTAVQEFLRGEIDARLLEILCCRGCVMGPGVSSDDSRFQRMASVRRYVQGRVEESTSAERDEALAGFWGMDLSRGFQADDTRLPKPLEGDIVDIVNKLGVPGSSGELNCGACGYAGCRDHAIAIYQGLAELDMCLPRTIEKMRGTLDELYKSNRELSSTKQALFNAEKIASMGQLSAGIAHELNNPLGVIQLYSNLLLDDMKEDNELFPDVAMIAQQAKRCKEVISGLLNFAKQNKVILRRESLPDWMEQCLAEIQIPAKIDLRIINKMRDPYVDMDAGQMSQVLSNLVFNAIDAMPEGGSLTIDCSDRDDKVYFTVLDTGHGIKPEHVEKVFEPLFTTKQMGRGTGLGLAVAYGILKMHRGNIKFETNSDSSVGETGTRFLVSFPRRAEDDSSARVESDESQQNTESSI